MTVVWLAVAQPLPPAARDREQARHNWLGGMAVLVGLLVCLALFLAVLNRWRKRPETQTPSANDQLAQFRELYEQGELSQAEFERIRAKLADQLRQEMELPEAPQPPPPPGGSVGAE